VKTIESKGISAGFFINGGLMPKKDLAAIGTKSFEELSNINEYGAEYWSARELQPLLGYTQWRRFYLAGGYLM
jgi:hypothetical protein